MKFSVGDRVLLKQTGEEGDIIAFIGKTMIEVSVNGVHFPAFLDEVDHPYLKWFTTEKKAVKKKSGEITIVPEKAPPARLAQSIYLSFLPVYRVNEPEDIVAQFRIFLLNETPTPIRFNYSLKSADGQTIFTHNGDLHAFGHIFLHNIGFDEMAGQPRFAWELAEAGGKKKSASQSGTLRIRPQKLFTHLQEMLENGQPSFAYPLVEDVTIMLDAKKKLELPEKILPLSPSENISLNTSIPYAEVIDLHASVLLNNIADIQPADILQQQISAMKKHLDTALAAGLDRIVIIHGIGAGVLREAVEAVLSGNDLIESFTNGWEGAYGYGATIAWFKRG